MKKSKKTKLILKGATFFLATFAFVGLFAIGAKFIKHSEVMPTDYQTQVAYADTPLNINYFDQAGADYSGSTDNLPTIYDGTDTVVLPIPTRAGYDFVGWFTDEECTNQITQLEPNTYTDDINLYAVWSAPSYLIICIANGEIVWQQNYTVEQQINVPNLSGDDVPDYYRFVGWTGTDLSEATKNVIVQVGSTGNRSYVAQFVGETFNINYYDANYEQCSGDTSALATTYRYDQTTTLGTPTREGYDFVGWHKNPNLSDAVVTKLDAESETNDIYLFAEWQAKTYNVSYRDQGNNIFTGIHGVGHPTSFVYDQGASLVNPTKTGYNFDGWYTDAACTNRVYAITSSTYAYDLTLYAKWTAQVYNIYYNNNVSFPGEYPNTHTYDQATDLVAAVRTGYTFAGWYTDSTLQNQVSQISAYSYTANFDLYAKWTLNSYSISYLDQYDRAYTGTTSGLPTTFDVESDVNLPTNPTRTGYNFDGWYTDSNCYNRIYTIYAGNYATDLILYAKWTNKPYTVTLNANGGNLYNNQMTVYFDSQYGYIEEPTRQYYQFEGWYLDSNFTQRVFEDTVYPYSINSNLYAKWSLIDYTVTLDVDGETEDFVFNTESDHFTFDNPTKTGYNFTGWLRSGYNQGTDYSPFDYTLDNYTLTAQFTPIEYTIRLTPDRELRDDYNNNAYEINYPGLFGVDHGYDIEYDDIVLPNIDVEEYGLIFLGWTGEGIEEPTKDLILEEGRIGNRQYTANFQGKEFTITFDANGGNVATATKTVEYSEAYGELPVPTFNAYDFKGWYDENGHRITSDELYLLKNDITLYARWDLTEYTIKRIVNGITFVKTYNLESRTYKLPMPYLKGYDFVGWIGTGLTEPTRNVSIMQGSSGNKVYEAQFELATYTITTKILGEETKTEYTMLSDDITIPAVELNGYTFIGWSGTDVSLPRQTITVEAGSVGNRVYVANLKAINYKLTLTVDGVDQEIEYTINSEDIAVANPKKGGYIFKGWQEEGSEDLVKDLIVEKGSTGDKHYTAVFEKDNTDRNIAIGLFSAGGAVLAAGVAVGTVALVKKKKKF